MAIYDNWCNAQICSYYRVWSFGYGNCISCELQGESEHITRSLKTVRTDTSYRTTQSMTMGTM